MKAEREDVAALQGGSSFVAYGFEVPHFPFRWHYHPEYELTLITRGSGKRMIGDSHESFESGDLVLIGPGIPHTWSNQPGERGSSAVVVQFSEAFLSAFTSLPECASIRELLAASKRGLYFPGTKLRHRVEELPSLHGPSRIIGLLSILERLSQTTSVALTSETYSAVRHGDANRINLICHYIQDNASHAVSVGEAAALVHLSPSAFCKFFKRHMGRGFSGYVNEVRIADACLQLTHTDKGIRQVALDCGFDSLTYFNRTFAKKRGITPSSFRKLAKAAS